MIRSRHIEISQEVAEKIKTGEYTNRLPGVYRLAKEYDVCHVTASKAVKELASQGYVTLMGTKGAIITSPNLKKPRSNNICIVGGPGVKYSFYAEYINEDAQRHGYKTILFTPYQSEILQDINFMSAFHVDGMIFREGSLTTDIIYTLRASNIPFISINRMPDESGVSWVDHDNEQALRNVLTAFYDMNHRRIAILGEKNRMDFHQENLHRTYVKFMKSKGIYDESLFAHDVITREYPHPALEQSKREALIPRIKTLLNLSSPPTAIYVESLFAAKILKNELEKAKLNVPDDISIITGCDDNQYSDKDVFWSVCMIPVRERSHLAFSELLRLINTQDEMVPPVKHFLKREIILKQSTASLAVRES